MKFLNWKYVAGSAFLFVLACSQPGHSQAVPTATQASQLSVFGGASGVWTDVLGGHNGSITAGVNFTFRPFYGLTPSLEVRGTYPVSSGTIAGEEHVAGGLKLERPYGRFHPYGDFLIGRGQISYQNGGQTVGNLRYISSNSTVYSPGAGVDIDLTNHWAAKADLQYQIWSTYPIEPKTLNPKVVTLGVIYRFDFNHYPKASKDRSPSREPAPAVRPPAAPPNP